MLRGSAIHYSSTKDEDESDKNYGDDDGDNDDDDVNENVDENENDEKNYENNYDEEEQDEEDNGEGDHDLRTMVIFVGFEKECWTKLDGCMCIMEEKKALARWSLDCINRRLRLRNKMRKNGFNKSHHQDSVETYKDAIKIEGSWRVVEETNHETFKGIQTKHSFST